MRFPLCRFLFLACYLAACWVGDAIADPPPATLSPEAVADFEWFGTLGFPDVKGCPAVSVATGHSISSVGGWHNTYTYGFLLRHTDDGRFTVLTTGLFTLDFVAAKPGTSMHERVNYEEQPLAMASDANLRDLARSATNETMFPPEPSEKHLSERAQVSTWAWACWRNGLDERAARLYACAVARPGLNPSELEFPFPERASLRERLKDDLSYAMIWPKDAGGFEAKAKRGDDLGGIDLTLTLDSTRSVVGENLNQRWNERVILNDDSLYGTEYSPEPELDRLFTLAKNFTEAANSALDAPPSAPFLLSVTYSDKQ